MCPAGHKAFTLDDITEHHVEPICLFLLNNLDGFSVSRVFHDSVEIRQYNQLVT